MPDYQQGKIYSLRSHQTNELYIGSTVETLSARMAKHRCDYKRWKEGKRCYISSYELLQYNDCYIELIEKCPCDCRMELEQREGQLIREMDCVNKCVVGRTMKEYRRDNKEKRAQYDKQRYEANKEGRAQYNKQYYEDNKERILQNVKQYREENKEQIKQRKNEKITCECGCTYTHVNKARHARSKKHQQYLASIQ